MRTRAWVLLKHLSLWREWNRTPDSAKDAKGVPDYSITLPPDLTVVVQAHDGSEATLPLSQFAMIAAPPGPSLSTRSV